MVDERNGGVTRTLLSAVPLKSGGQECPRYVEIVQKFARSFLGWRGSKEQLWNMKFSHASLFAALLLSCSAAFPATPHLKVSENKHFFVTENGEPFFWLGDTAWKIFHRLNREDAERYLDNRAQLGFTVIQAVALAEFDGHTIPNACGFLPLTDLDPTRPAVQDGPDNDYWDHVDFIVEKANARGLTIGFLPTWGRYWHDKVKDGRPLFTPENAAIYGEWIGRRYKDAGLVWILGGDRGFDNEEQKDTIRALARGLRKGDGGAHLISLHPNGGGKFSQRTVARFQHAAERSRPGIHRALRPHARGLQPHPTEAEP